MLALEDLLEHCSNFDGISFEYLKITWDGFGPDTHIFICKEQQHRRSCAPDLEPSDDTLG